MLQTRSRRPGRAPAGKRRAPELARVLAHLAIIMDGNGRWAWHRLWPRVAGHRAGLNATLQVIEEYVRQHIGVLTLFAFSSENWQRSAPAVDGLMDLLLGALTSEIPDLHRNGGGVHFIGARTRFSAALQTGMREAERLTQANTRLRLNVAAGYGGRRDLVEAARWLAGGVAAGQILPADIDAALLGQHLALGDGPDPELFIRTGGKPRIRNFLLWNLAYTELYFTNTPWPDIDAGGLQTALHWFAERERRFGGVPELNEAKSGA